MKAIILTMLLNTTPAIPEVQTLDVPREAGYSCRWIGNVWRCW